MRTIALSNMSRNSDITECFTTNCHWKNIGNHFKYFSKNLRVKTSSWVCSSSVRFNIFSCFVRFGLYLKMFSTTLRYLLNFVNNSFRPFNNMRFKPIVRTLFNTFLFFKTKRYVKMLLF